VTVDLVVEGVCRTDCLPGVECCVESMSVLGRGVSVSMRDVLCLCQSVLERRPSDDMTYCVLLPLLRDSTAAFADKALWCTAFLMLPNHDCFLLRVSDLSNAARAGEPSSGSLGAIFCSAG
jgi:hypothetical protein